MAKFTVFGGRGFIGSKIVEQLIVQGHETYVPGRDDRSIFTRKLGIVIYCAGNGDCDNMPFSVLEANVNLLSQILQSAEFDRLVYISSTRVYMNQKSSLEQDNLTVCIDDNRRLFNLTKLVGEELCLKSKRDVCVVRPSNVYGVALNSTLFLPAITRNAINYGKIDMYISKEYAKDYVCVDDVVSACIHLSMIEDAKGRIINIASGDNVTAGKIAEVLQRYTSCEVIWHEVKYANENFPVTNIDLLKNLIKDYSPRNVLDDLQEMISDFKSKLKKYN